MVLLIFPMVFYLTHSSPRYRFPMDPIIVVLAASSAAHLLSARFELHKAKTVEPLPLIRRADPESAKFN